MLATGTMPAVLSGAIAAVMKWRLTFGAQYGPSTANSIAHQKLSTARAWMRQAPEGVSGPGESAVAAVTVEEKFGPMR